MKYIDNIILFLILVLPASLISGPAIPDILITSIGSLFIFKNRSNIKSIYNKLPLFFRVFIFFFFRYFVQLGFVDAKRGFIWSILQCFWYRMLIDVKIIEVYTKAGKKKEDIIKYFFDNFNYDITKPS